MTIELDYMEYANDGLAQAAYVTSEEYSADRIPTMTSNTAPSGVASANHEDPVMKAWMAMNDTILSNNDMWYAAGGFPHWIQYQFTSGKVIQQYTINSRDDPVVHYPADWTFEASNTGAWGGEEVVLDTITGESFAQNQKKTYPFANSTSYTYYRLDITSGGHGTVVGIAEFELLELILQSYSEDTIKEQGTYSLKGFAKGTDSLNDTLTRTVGPTIDLSGIDKLRFEIYASRTGSNIKIGIHDSGGTTTEITPNVASGNTWQPAEWDISGVADANKDVIDSIIITVVNADADNTFYIDDFREGWQVLALTRKLGFVRSHISTVSGIGTRTLGLTRSFTLGPGHLGVTKKLGLIRSSHTSVITGLLTRKLGLVRSHISTITGLLTRKLGLVQIHISTVYKYIVELRFYNRSGALVKIISSKSQNFPLIEPGLDFAFTRNGGCGAFSFTTSEDLSLEYNFRCDIYLYERKWFSGYLTKLPQVGTGLTYHYEGWGFVEQIDWQTINETYTGDELSAIAEDILDTYITPNTDVLKGA